MSSRRGTTLALVLALYLALGSILLGAVTLAGASRAAAERDYRRSQALALAEAGIAEAQARQAPHGARPLGAGTYSWSATDGRITARGEVPSTSGATVTRTVTAVLTPGGRITSWEEGP
jgi:hypothetical protein